MTSKESNKKSTSLFLDIIELPNGSITRPQVPVVPSTDQHSVDPNSPVLFKDITLNPDHKTSLRLFLPNNNNNEKLPIIFYYHGGGFVLFGHSSVPYHYFCQEMAAAVPAIVVSLDYRLAPESRLPAAYDDAAESLSWVCRSADSWIQEYGDLSRCFLVGASAGGSMAYFAGLRAVTGEVGLDPEVKLGGLVLIQPYFGGEERTQSEIESEEDNILPLRANETMWRLALPLGADRDHEYCNPSAKKNVKAHEIALLPKTMVMGCKGDPLFDRQKIFVKTLADAGCKVVDRLEEEEEGYHAIELFDPVRANAMFAEIREFVHDA